MDANQRIIFAQDTEERQRLLAQMYKAKQRPTCPCRTPQAEMYIAKFNDYYVVKRMPNTGPTHSPDCDSYEPPPELSGLGDVLGTAIKENDEDGLTELKLGFSMAKITGRAAQTPSNEDNDSVRTDGSKLTLRSILHYLWEEAGFHRWSPAMAGKRSWMVVRKHLLLSAETKIIKGDKLSERLYIPEPFTLEKKDAINHRRMSLMSKLKVMHGKQRELMLFIGEVKEIAQARFGHKIVIKHAPDFPFLLNEDIHERLQKHYVTDMELWESLEDVHMIAVGTFSLNAAYCPVVEEISLMLVTSNWIPMETIHDKAIIDKLTATNRRFMKGLRYNLPKSKPLASVVLTDTAPQPTAMYAIPTDVEEDFIIALDALKEDSILTSWTWNTLDYDMPEIPPAVAHRK